MDIAVIIASIVIFIAVGTLLPIAIVGQNKKARAAMDNISEEENAEENNDVQGEDAEASDNANEGTCDNANN